MKTKSKVKTKKKKENKKNYNPAVLIGSFVLVLAVSLLFLGHQKPLQNEEAKQGEQPLPYGQTVQKELASSPGAKRLLLSPHQVLSESSITAEVEGGDFPSGSKLAYEWERNGIVIPYESSPVLEKIQFKRGDTIQVTLLVDGGKERLKSEPAVVQNSPPKITSARIEPAQPGRGDKLQVKAESSDEEGDPVTYRYRWFKEDGSTVGNESGLSAKPFSKGNKVMVEVTPFDGESEGKGVVASVVIANTPPRITSNPVPFSGREYSYQVTAEDPDQDPLTFKLTKRPPGMAIDPKTGLIKWAFTEKDQGVHPVEIRVSDPDGAEVVQTFEIPLSFATTPAPSATIAGSEYGK